MVVQVLPLLGSVIFSHKIFHLFIKKRGEISCFSSVNSTKFSILKNHRMIYTTNLGRKKRKKKKKEGEKNLG